MKGLVLTRQQYAHLLFVLMVPLSLIEFQSVVAEK
jgi:hypothetical protein